MAKKKDLKVGMQNPDFGFWVSLLNDLFCEK